MVVADVRRVFTPYVIGEDLSIGNGQFVALEFFVMLFGAASATPTRDELDTIDAGTKGYGEFFARCQAEGLIA